MLIEILHSDPGILVVGQASNGQEALDLVGVLQPDLITMDVEMPVMGGLEAIERIMAVQPLPILVVTSLSTAATAFPAVSRGAMDIIAKPAAASVKSRQEFLTKVHLVAGVNVKACLAFRGQKPDEAKAPVAAFTQVPVHERIVAIAASTGGPQAILAILAGLPAGFPAALVIAQHIGDGFASGMAEWLGRSTPLQVKVAVDGATLAPGLVLINPAEASMRVDAKGTVSLGKWDSRQLYRPSCNGLLCSVAAAYGQRTVGIILSGMGDDGVEGMLAIRQAGGVTLAQDADTSVIFGMNRLAVERGCIQEVLPPDRIAAELVNLVGAE
jgi:two-component system chemotaxis response regulator CheB